MNRTLLTGVVCLIWLGLTYPVPGQSVLERLEQRIRGAQDGPADESQPEGPVGGAKQGVAADRQRGYLGAVADDSKDRGRGVRLLEIRPGTPAEKAGLRPKDLVTGLAGIRIRQMADMAGVLEVHAPGDSLDFEVLRNGQTIKIKVTLGRRPDAVPVRPPTGVAKPPVKPLTVKPPPVEPPPVGPRLSDPAVHPANDATSVEQLQRRIERLERRLAELERLIGKLPKKP